MVKTYEEKALELEIDLKRHIRDIRKHKEEGVRLKEEGVRLKEKGVISNIAEVEKEEK